jgi:hypothetical protein
VILHDMTNCLRIGDMTVIRNDGSRQTVEINAGPLCPAAAHRCCERGLGERCSTA